MAAEADASEHGIADEPSAEDVATDISDKPRAKQDTHKQVASSSGREVPDAVFGPTPESGQDFATISNPEERAALLEAELAATKASLATYQSTVQHLAQELATTKQQQQQQQQQQASSPTPGVLAASQSPAATQPTLAPKSSYALSLLTVCTSPEVPDASGGSLSPLGPFALATISSSSLQVLPTCSQQDMPPCISGSSESPSVVAAMQGFPGASRPPLVSIPAAVMSPLMSPHQDTGGMALASPAEQVAGEHLQPYLAASVSTSDFAGSTELVFPLGAHGMLSPFNPSGFSSSNQDRAYSMDPAADVSWSGLREDQTKSGSITSGTTRYVQHPYHRGVYQEQLQVQAMHPLQGSYDGSMQQLIQQQHDQQQQQVAPGQAQQLLPAQGAALAIPAGEGQAHAAMLQQYAAAGMLQDPSAAVAAAGTPAIPGMGPPQELLTAMGSLTLSPVPGSAGAYMGPMPQALPQEWAFVNAQAAAANQASVYAQARVQAQMLAQVQAAQVAQAQVVALEQHQQQQQAFMMQQQFQQQQQYNPYAQQLVALASQQHQQSTRQHGRRLPHQNSWPQDTHQKRDTHRKQHHQQAEKPRTVRSRDDPPDWRRIFVGNIGWWVNESLLQQWFSAYGKVIDTQVMWNTKLLAKGKKVNREFAFISYSTPEEAANAIRHMHGCYVEGLTKDKDGLTVQYEAQGTGRSQQLLTPPNVPIAGPSRTW